ncbi:recombinase family protein [Aneurinibacillus sp. BA2021]|nr:recombinase family protein [Aneurinibacillus sp. BA2021]
MRCAVYVRVSTDSEEQKQSLEHQKSLFYNFIHEMGWELYDIYVDVETGTTAKRKGFNRMIQDAEARKFDCILAKELSRLARNAELAYKIKRILQAHKIHLVTLDQAINTLEDNMDKFGLYAWLYEEESQRISRRVRIGLKESSKAGNFKGSTPPYGYYVVNKRLIPRSDGTVQAVQLIFNLYIQGKGFDAIAKELNARKYPTPAQLAGKKNAGLFWNGSSVQVILKNPHYTGDLVQGRTTTRSVTDRVRETVEESELIVVQGTHEPLVSHQDFKTVQEIMRNRYIERPRAKKHLFTNVAYCADCGSSMWYMYAGKRYVCSRYRRHGKHICASHSVKEQYLKDLILQDIREITNGILRNGEVIGRVKNHVTKSQRKRDKEIAGKEKEIAEIKEENRNLIRLLAQGIIQQAEYRSVAQENTIKINRLEREVLEAKKANDKQKNQQIELQKIVKQVENILEFEELTEGLLHRLVERIEVDEFRNVKVYYRFADPFSFDN